MTDIFALQQESDRIIREIKLLSEELDQDLAGLEGEIAEQRLAIDEAKALLESIEAAIVDEVLAQDGLSNEARRKAAISKALAQDESYKAATAELHKRQYNQRIAEADLSQAQATRGGRLAVLAALGKAADLIGHQFHVAARERELEASQVRLKAIAQRVLPNF